MTKQRLISGVLLGWFVVTGCGGESAAEGTPSPDEVEEEQEEDETEPPGVSAYESLTECAAVEPCQGESSFAQMIEGDSSRILHAGTACVLAGLRDRTPGRYLHQTDATWGNGSAGSHHVILIRHDGIVLYTRDSYASGTFAPADVVEPGQRCTLKSEEFFDACYAAVTAPGGDSDAAFTCAYSGSKTSSAPIDWFESCETDAAPSCE
jgi:hypothetical protein